MVIDSAELIYFSPTSTTRRIVEAIAQGLMCTLTKPFDLTPPPARTQVFQEMTGELAIIGAPVYGGRLPEEAVFRLRRLKGNDIPAVIVVVYGNRAYEDALLELRDLSISLGFRPVAGGAFIGEHSYSGGTTLIAQGRPDGEDLKMAIEFGQAVRKKLKDVPSSSEFPLLQVSGQFPYKELKLMSHHISTDDSRCTRCGICVNVCPTASITINNTVVTNSHICIACCACIKECPTEVRMMDDPGIMKVKEWLFSNCSQPRQPETFL